MIDFLTYLEGQGVHDVDDLMHFIAEFLVDPAVFFEMTDAERAALLNRMDQALSAL